MKRKRYTEEKIISILKEHDAGASAPDFARRHGVSELDKAVLKELVEGKW